MKNKARILSAFATVLCTTPWVASCTATRHDETAAAPANHEVKTTEGPKSVGAHDSVPAALIVPMKANPAETAGAKPAITLHVGDAAPELSYDQWIQGTQVHGFEAGKVSVVEFWATWCGPCIASIPHINSLQHDNPDVVFLGMAGSERAPKEGTPDARLDNLRSFIAKQGDQMTYRVAYDADRSMSNTWMKPAGQGGIPCAFVIGRDGKIAWIGHPTEMEAPLAAAVSAH